MKKILLIASLLIIAVSTLVDAQTLIQLDFKTKQFAGGNSLQNLKQGDFYQFKINNINTNLYKISIGKSDSVIHKELPFPTFGAFGIDALQGLVSSLSTGNLLGSIKNISLSQDTLKDFMLGGNFKSDLEKLSLKDTHRLPTKLEVIKGLMSAYEIVLKDNFIKLNALKIRTDNLVNEYNKFLFQIQIEDSSNTDVATLFSTSKLSPDDLYAKLNAIRFELNQLNDDIINANNKYIEITKQYSDDIEKSTSLKATDDQLKATYTVFSTTVAKAIDVVSPDNAMKLINSVLVAVNNKERSYTSLPLQFTKDLNTLAINIIPRKEDIGLEPYATAFSFPFKKNDFWAVSSGLYISGLYNHSYSTLKTISPTDTTYTIHSENPAKWELGINTMIRYGSKIGKKDNLFWHLGFGPGVSVSDKIRPRGLLGGGLAFGSRSKIILDFGVIAGYTEQLSVLYKEKEKYFQAPSGVTVSKLNADTYFSIGYLFN